MRPSAETVASMRGVVESVHILVLVLGLAVDEGVVGLGLEDVGGLPLVGSLSGAVKAYVVGGANSSINLHMDGEPVGVISSGNLKGGVINKFCTCDVPF